MSRSILLGLIALVSSILIMSGCDNNTLFEDWRIDPELRREIFKECMEILPAGPEETVYNDWDEVVDECGTQAYYMSRYCTNCGNKEKNSE